MSEQKRCWYQFKKDGKWWNKPHKLTEAEAKEEFEGFGYEFKKHWANK